MAISSAHYGPAQGQCTLYYSYDRRFVNYGGVSHVSFTSVLRHHGPRDLARCTRAPFLLGRRSRRRGRIWHTAPAMPPT